MSLMFDAVVIGGGLGGASTAYHLAKAGAKTLLVDRHHEGRATDAGAGILAPETAGLSAGPAWFDLALASGQHYRELVHDLQTEQPGEVGYAPASHLMVAVDADEDAAFTQGREVVYARQKARGLPSPDMLHDVSSSEAQAIFPALAETRGAVLFKGAATVDGRTFNRALLNAAQSFGLQVKNAEVSRLLLNGKQVIGIVVNGEEVTAGTTILAGGAWSTTFSNQLGVTLPIEPQRGQIIHLQFPESVDTSTWPIVTAFHGHYMLSWPDHRVTIGATRETGSGFHPVTTAAGVMEVLREGLRVAPGLAAGAIKEIRVGLRPATPDHYPILGPLPGINGLQLATGYGASGLQLAPFSGKIVAELAQGKAAPVNIDAFRAERFLN